MLSLRRRLASATAILLFSSATLYADNLQQIFDLAETNDPEIRVAEAELKANLQTRKIARSGLLPQISGNARYADSNTNAQTPGLSAVEVSETSFGASLSQAIFDLPAWYDFKQGDAIAEQAETEYLLAKQDLIVRVSEAYIDVLRAVDDLITVSSEEKALASQLEQAQQRFEVGLVAITDVHEAQATYDDVTARLIQARGALGIAFEGLNLITGQNHLAVAPLGENYPVTNPEPNDPQLWVDMALANNYSLASSLLARDAASYGYKSTLASHLPTVNFSYQYSERRLDGESTSIQSFVTFEDNENFQFAFTVDVPLYTGGLQRGQRKQAYYQFVQSEENVNNVKRSLVQNTRNAHLAVVTGAAAVRARSQAVVSFESALEATQAGYDVGTRNLVDLLNAERAVFQAQRDFLNARYDYILNLLNLKRAAGTLTSSDLSQINNHLDLNNEVAKSVLLASQSQPANQTPLADQVVVQKADDQEALNTSDEPTGTGTIESLLAAWSSAWQDVRIDDYLSFYAKSYPSSDRGERQLWENGKRNRLSAIRNPIVSLSNIHVEFIDDAERAEARFVQRYRDSVYADVTEKALILAKEEGEWKIIQERALSIEAK